MSLESAPLSRGGTQADLVKERQGNSESRITPSRLSSGKRKSRLTIDDPPFTSSQTARLMQHMSSPDGSSTSASTPEVRHLNTRMSLETLREISRRREKRTVESVSHRSGVLLSRSSAAFNDSVEMRAFANFLDYLAKPEDQEDEEEEEKEEEETHLVEEKKDLAEKETQQIKPHEETTSKIDKRVKLDQMSDELEKDETKRLKLKHGNRRQFPTFDYDEKVTETLLGSSSQLKDRSDEPKNSDFLTNTDREIGDNHATEKKIRADKGKLEEESKTEKLKSREMRSSTNDTELKGSNNNSEDTMSDTKNNDTEMVIADDEILPAAVMNHDQTPVKMTNSTPVGTATTTLEGEMHKTLAAEPETEKEKEKNSSAENAKDNDTELMIRDGKQSPSAIEQEHLPAEKTNSYSLATVEEDRREESTEALEEVTEDDSESSDIIEDLDEYSDDFEETDESEVDSGRSTGLKEDSESMGNESLGHVTNNSLHHVTNKSLGHVTNKSLDHVTNKSLRPVTKVATTPKQRKKKGIQDIHYSLIDTPYVKMPLRSIYSPTVRRQLTQHSANATGVNNVGEKAVYCYMCGNMTYDLDHAIKANLRYEQISKTTTKHSENPKYYRIKFNPEHRI